jgi:chromosome segregation ATPase
MKSLFKRISGSKKVTFQEEPKSNSLSLTQPEPNTPSSDLRHDKLVNSFSSGTPNRSLQRSYSLSNVNSKKQNHLLSIQPRRESGAASSLVAFQQLHGFNQSNSKNTVAASDEEVASDEELPPPPPQNDDELPPPPAPQDSTRSSPINPPEFPDESVPILSIEPPVAENSTTRASSTANSILGSTVTSELSQTASLTIYHSHSNSNSSVSPDNYFNNPETRSRGQSIEVREDLSAEKAPNQHINKNRPGFILTVPVVSHTRNESTVGELPKFGPNHYSPSSLSTQRLAPGPFIDPNLSPLALNGPLTSPGNNSTNMSQNQSSPLNQTELLAHPLALLANSPHVVRRPSVHLVAAGMGGSSASPLPYSKTLAQLQESQARLAEAQEELTRLQDKLEEASEKATKAAEELANYKLGKMGSEADIIKLNDEIAQLRGEVKSKGKSKATLQWKIFKIQQKYETTKEQLDRAVENVQKAEAEKEAALRELEKPPRELLSEQNTSEINEITATNEELIRTKAELSELQRDYQEVKQDLAELQEKMEKSQSGTSAEQGKIGGLEREINNWSQRYTSAENQLAAKEVEFAKMRNDLSQAKAELQSSQSQLEAFQHNFINTANESAALSNLLQTQLSTAQTNLTASQQKLNQTQTELLQANSKLLLNQTEAQLSLTTSQDAIQDLKERLNNAEANLLTLEASAEDNATKSKHTIAQLTVQLTHAQNKLSELPSNPTSTTNDSSAEIFQLREKLEQSQNQFLAAQTQLTQDQDAIQSHSQSLQSYKQQLEQMKLQLEQAQAKLREAESKAVQSASNNSENENMTKLMQQQLARLQDAATARQPEFEALQAGDKSAIANLERNLTTSKHNINELTLQLTQLQAKYDQLQASNKKFSHESSNQNTELSRQLADAEEKLFNSRSQLIQLQTQLEIQQEEKNSIESQTKTQFELLQTKYDQTLNKLNESLKRETQLDRELNKQRQETILLRADVEQSKRAKKSSLQEQPKLTAINNLTNSSLVKFLALDRAMNLCNSKKSVETHISLSNGFQRWMLQTIYARVAGVFQQQHQQWQEEKQGLLQKLVEAQQLLLQHQTSAVSASSPPSVLSPHSPHSTTDSSVHSRSVSINSSAPISARRLTNPINPLTAATIPENIIDETNEVRYVNGYINNDFNRMSAERGSNSSPYSVSSSHRPRTAPVNIMTITRPSHQSLYSPALHQPQPIRPSTSAPRVETARGKSTAVDPVVEKHANVLFNSPALIVSTLDNRRAPVQSLEQLQAELLQAQNMQRRLELQNKDLLNNNSFAKGKIDKARSARVSRSQSVERISTKPAPAQRTVNNKMSVPTLQLNVVDRAIDPISLSGGNISSGSGGLSPLPHTPNRKAVAFVVQASPKVGDSTPLLDHKPPPSLSLGSPVPSGAASPLSVLREISDPLQEMKYQYLPTPLRSKGPSAFASGNNSALNSPRFHSGPFSTNLTPRTDNGSQHNFPLASPRPAYYANRLNSPPFAQRATSLNSNLSNGLADGELAEEVKRGVWLIDGLHKDSDVDLYSDSVTRAIETHFNEWLLPNQINLFGARVYKAIRAVLRDLDLYELSLLGDEQLHRRITGNNKSFPKDGVDLFLFTQFCNRIINEW